MATIEVLGCRIKDQGHCPPLRSVRIGPLSPAFAVRSPSSLTGAGDGGDWAAQTSAPPTCFCWPEPEALVCAIVRHTCRSKRTTAKKWVESRGGAVV